MHTPDHQAASRRRWLLFLLVHAIALMLIVAAFVFRSVIDLLPPRADGSRISACILHDAFHLYCPLCGGTRALISLCRGQLLSSLLQNPVSAYLTVGFVVFDVIALVRMLRRSPLPLVRIPKWYVIGAIVLAVLVFIVRNALMIFYGIDNLDGLALYW